MIMRIISSAPGFWPGENFNISLSHSQSEVITEGVTYQVIKLKTSVNVDTRKLKFGTKDPWGY